MGGTNLQTNQSRNQYKTYRFLRRYKSTSLGRFRVVQISAKNLCNPYLAIANGWYKSNVLVSLKGGWCK